MSRIVLTRFSFNPDAVRLSGVGLSPLVRDLWFATVAGCAVLIMIQRGWMDELVLADAATNTPLDVGKPLVSSHLWFAAGAAG